MSASSWRVWRGASDQKMHQYVQASDFITPEERQWMRTDEHQIARRLRFWLELLCDWPFPEPPILLVRPLIAAMRMVRAGTRLPSGAKLEKLLSEFEVGDDVVLAARRAGMTAELAQDVLVINGRM